VKAIYLARRLARMAWARKAEDIVILDLRGLSDSSEFFVICTGKVGQHVRSVTDFVTDEARALGERPFVTEKDSDEWMVADFVDVTFHCFQPDKRVKYDLEGLWDEAVFMSVDPETGTAQSLKEAREETIARLEKKEKLKGKSRARK
jgi:ribosome-associated protein